MSWLNEGTVTTAEDKANVALSIAWEAWKVARAKAVSEIIVETTSGLVFDGDEDSQNRMTRAIALGTSDEDTTEWKLADNTLAIVPVSELKEALYLAGIRQTAIWMGHVEV